MFFRRAPLQFTIKRIGIVIVLVWTLVVTVLRAVRRPNDFAEAHWLLDYRFGFVKRGLIGTLVSGLTAATGTRPTEGLVAALSGTAFIVFCVVMLVLGLRIIQRAGWSGDSTLAVLVFLSSPFMVMSAHLVGYFDNILLTLAVVSLVLLVKGRTWLAATVQALAIVIHESALLVSFPVFCFSWLLMNSQRRQPGGARLPWAPLLLPVGTFVAVAAAASIFLPPGLEQSFAKRLSEFPFIADRRDTLAPWWLTITFAEYYALEGGRFLERLSSTPMYGLVLPSLLALLGFTFDQYRFRILSAASIVLLGVCLAPQTLHAIAVDTPRIWTYSIAGAFLSLWACSQILTPGREASPALRVLFVVALVTNVMSLTPLMDGERDRFTLQMRLLLYAPVLAFALAVQRERVPE